MKNVPMTLNGEQYRLRIDINAMADAEERLGMGFGKIMHQELSMSFLRVMLWAGLKWQHRRLTPEKVGGMLQRFVEDGGDIEKIGIKITEAIVASGLVKQDEEDEDSDIYEAGAPGNGDGEDLPGDGEAKNTETEADSKKKGWLTSVFKNGSNG
ncbi:MAG: hypothetical protein FH749_06780 [Firmicutes bacterium]|nr:hypothetical protein [Bacillota bacterium]